MTVRQQGVRQTNQHVFLQVNIGVKSQCLSKEIGVGVVISCWRRSKLRPHPDISMLVIPKLDNRFDWYAMSVTMPRLTDISMNLSNAITGPPIKPGVPRSPDSSNDCR